jgi:hypothetical protein
MITDDSCAPTLPQNISNLSFANRFYSIVPNMPTSDLNASNGDQDSASVASNSTEPSRKKQRSISKQEVVSVSEKTPAKLSNNFPGDGLLSLIWAMKTSNDVSDLLRFTKQISNH